VPTEAGPIEYTVVEGDTWYGIAEAYGVDAENLAAVNGLTLDDFLQPGDVIVIPQ
jgi:LysM repeat protein